MKKRFAHDRHVRLLIWLSGRPAMVVALVLTWHTEWTSLTKWTRTGFRLAAWLGGAFATRERVIRPLPTLSHRLSALREEDFSCRGSHVTFMERLQGCMTAHRDHEPDPSNFGFT